MRVSAGILGILLIITGCVEDHVPTGEVRDEPRPLPDLIVVRQSDESGNPVSGPVGYCRTEIDPNGTHKLVVLIKNVGAGVADPDGVGMTTHVIFVRNNGEKIQKDFFKRRTFNPGEWEEFAFEIPANMFDPDLDFVIELDVKNVINEGTAGEANNKVSGRCIG